MTPYEIAIQIKEKQTVVNALEWSLKKAVEPDKKLTLALDLAHVREQLEQLKKKGLK